MPTLHVPDEGLRVPGPSLQVPEEKPTAKAAYPAPFAVKINVTERFLEELSSGKQNFFMLQTGKGQMFEFMHTQELFYNELYRQSGGENGMIVPLGIAKDKLELLEVVEKKNGIDVQTLALKEQMEALQRKKKDKRYTQPISRQL
ncbi:hypothetical protein ABW19_dt0205542 [Dactylella cylindrospora]|nr:hypothetical protein ABW19_dt0205542 [Dactylella cylindrospora]